ncbi:hypothetical protein, partial [Enterobacter cloacae]|uniref:hypothetical protein n=1 Tax=Enterobacter cloacae TaxID=550 RepID=UPI0019530B42
TKIVMDAVARRAAIGKPMKVHFVGHSAGALLVGALLGALSERGGTVSDFIASVSLFAPACTTGYFGDNLQPVADRLAKR